jgi:hypothetical protein
MDRTSGLIQIMAIITAMYILLIYVLIPRLWTGTHNDMLMTFISVLRYHIFPISILPHYHLPPLRTSILILLCGVFKLFAGKTH